MIFQKPFLQKTMLVLGTRLTDWFVDRLNGRGSLGTAQGNRGVFNWRGRRLPDSGA